MSINSTKQTKFNFLIEKNCLYRSCSPETFFKQSFRVRKFIHKYLIESIDLVSQSLWNSFISDFMPLLSRRERNTPRHAGLFAALKIVKYVQRQTVDFSTTWTWCETQTELTSMNQIPPGTDHLTVKSGDGWSLFVFIFAFERRRRNFLCLHF